MAQRSPGKYERLSAERHARDLALCQQPGGHPKGFRFDAAAGERVVQFIERYCRHHKGEWAGQLIQLSDVQRAIITQIFGWLRRDGTRRFRIAYVEVPRKFGKALALDTPIPTPSGWTTMGMLKVGDLLFDERGEICSVVAVTEPQLGRPCYAVEFSGGDTIVADAEHEWLTKARVNMPGERSRRTIRRFRMPKLCIHRIGGRDYYVAQLYGRQKHIGAVEKLLPLEAFERFAEFAHADLATTPFGVDSLTRVRTTREIAATVHHGKRRDLNHSVPVCGQLRLPPQELPVPPYTLGAWLGDGNSASAAITCAMSDAEILENIRLEGVTAELRNASGFTGHYLLGRGHLQRTLRKAGLLGAKHIPAIYLRASSEQRLALLQGLMDTDGSITVGQGQCEFTTTAHPLALGVAELAASLGLRPRIYEGRATLYGRDCGPKWRVFFHAYDDVPVFRLPRKRARLARRPAMRSQQGSRTITAVRKVPSVPVRCIQVDSPSRMYLAGRHFIPTHNSTLAGGLGLYLAIADGEAGAEVYSSATKKEQAAICWEDGARMVKASPELKRFVRVLRNSIVCERMGSKFAPLGADSKTLDGLNPHGNIVDELHAHRDRGVWDVLDTAMGARRQPLTLAITTAGTYAPEAIGWQMHDYAVKVLEGVIEDDSFFAFIAAADEPPADNPEWYFTEEAQRQANPGFGVTPSADFLAGQAAKARAQPAFLNEYLRLHLNVWTRQVTRWLQLDKWAACEPELVGVADARPVAAAREKALEGRVCFGGLDLSTKWDLSALALVFPGEADVVDVVCRFWLPEATVELYARKGQRHYETWAREGWLTVTPGNVVDYEFIRAEANALAKRYQVRELAFDAWGATDVSTRLMGDGLTMVECRQGFKTLSEPSKDLEARVLAKKVRHAGNPVLRFCVSNAVVTTDAAGNIKPDKAKAADRIDGVVAMVMALSRVICAKAAPVSPYESRGILLL